MNQMGDRAPQVSVLCNLAARTRLTDLQTEKVKKSQIGFIKQKNTKMTNQEMPTQALVPRALISFRLHPHLSCQRAQQHSCPKQDP